MTNPLNVPWRSAPTYDTDTQTETIRQILEAVFPWVILKAQMQSGKTKVALLAAIIWLLEDQKRTANVISGFTDIGVKTQWEETKKQLLYGKNSSEPCLNLERHVARDIDNRLKILWNSPLQTVNSNPSLVDRTHCDLSFVEGGERLSYENCLWIIDESHHGAAKDSVIDKFFRNLGINPNGDPEPLNQLCAKVWSISATPFSEETDKHKFEQHKKTVKYLPGPTFRGVEVFREEGKIHKSFHLGDNENTRELLARWRAKMRYHLVRSSKKEPHQFQQLAESMGFSVLSYNATVTSDIKSDEFIKMLKSPPTKPTIIILKGLVKMGTDLTCKLHLGFVFDTPAKSHHATIVQGLLGRMCGYKTTPDDLEIYVTDPDKVESYLNWWSTDESPSLEGVCDRHMKPAKRSKLLEKSALPEDDNLPNGPIPDDFFQGGNQDDPIDRQENTVTPSQLAIRVQFREGMNKKAKIQCTREALIRNSDFPQEWCRRAIGILDKSSQVRMQGKGEAGKHFNHPDNRLAHVKKNKYKQDTFTLIVDKARGLVYLDIFTWQEYEEQPAGKVFYYCGLKGERPCGHFYTKGTMEMIEDKADTIGSECWGGSTEVPLPPLEEEPEGGTAQVTPDQLEQISKRPDALKLYLADQIGEKEDGTPYLKTNSLRAPEGDLVLIDEAYLPGQSRWSKKSIECLVPPQLELVDFMTPEKNKGYSQRGRAQKTAGWKLPTISEGGGPLRIIRGGLKWKLRTA